MLEISEVLVKLDKSMQIKFPTTVPHNNISNTINQIVSMMMITQSM